MTLHSISRAVNPEAVIRHYSSLPDLTGPCTVPRPPALQHQLLYFHTGSSGGASSQCGAAAVAATRAKKPLGCTAQAAALSWERKGCGGEFRIENCNARGRDCSSEAKPAPVRWSEHENTH